MGFEQAEAEPQSAANHGAKCEPDNRINIERRTAHTFNIALNFRLIIREPDHALNRTGRFSVVPEGKKLHDDRSGHQYGQNDAEKFFVLNDSFHKSNSFHDALLQQGKYTARIRQKKNGILEKTSAL